MTEKQKQAIKIVLTQCNSSHLDVDEALELIESIVGENEQTVTAPITYPVPYPVIVPDITPQPWTVTYQTNTGNKVQ